MEERTGSSEKEEADGTECDASRIVHKTFLGLQNSVTTWRLPHVFSHSASLISTCKWALKRLLVENGTTLCHWKKSNISFSSSVCVGVLAVARPLIIQLRQIVSLIFHFVWLVGSLPLIALEPNHSVNLIISWCGSMCNLFFYAVRRLQLCGACGINLVNKWDIKTYCLIPRVKMELYVSSINAGPGSSWNW